MNKAYRNAACIAILGAILAPAMCVAMTAAPDMLYATGEGAMATPKEQPNRAKALLQAKSYAKSAAIATLVEQAWGTMISSTSEGRGYVSDTRIKQEIKGVVVSSVQVVSAKKRPEGNDTIVEVTVRAPKPAPKVVPPAPAKWSPSWVISPGSDPPGAKDGGYTSVVVDTQGLRLAKSMSPKLLRPDGSEVWGTIKVDYDFLSDYGIVAYARSRAEAYASKRAGRNPLVIRALSRSKSSDKASPVISDADAELLIAEDRRCGFLGEFRVIIVVD